jgi:guanylate kinase
MESLYKRNHHPILLLISGPSGVGKDTIARRIIDTRPDDFYFVVTATTRPIRAGEVEGYDYYFTTNDEFAQMIEDDDLLEYAVVYNDYKGIPKKHIREALASGKDVIMRVDVQGAETIRKLIPNVITVFLTTETEASLVQRLRERKSETAEGLNLRIAAARQEMRRLKEFDYWVINANDKADQAVNEMLAIIDAAHCRIAYDPIVL